ncbi:MAG: hypothetical protein LBT46_07415 [Planctomycetaceae bacterium]|jgi:hypothetical protein|nr:hypothetical protein [Planctomycetaceae bacterium]
MRDITVFFLCIFLYIAIGSLSLCGAVRQEEELYAVKASSINNTVEEHKEMALWCSGHQLPEKARYHWNQILVLDADNAQARSALDYIKDKSGWILRTEKLENRGLVRDKGEWKTRQQIEVENILAEQKAAVNQWRKKIAVLRKSLPSQRAEQELLNIDDALASEALIDAVKSERDTGKKIIMIRAAAHISSTQTLLFLIDCSMKPEEPENVRNCCVEELQDCLQRHPDSRTIIQAAYCLYLRPEAYPPLAINEAGRILGELQIEEAVAMLIDVLVTTHKFVRKEETQSDSYSTGNVGLSRGARTVRGKTESPNQGVLAALKKLTNADYQFDQPTWRKWYQQQRRTPELNLRRI